MKKLLSLLAVLLCAVLLSTTAFAASADPLAVYKKYLKNSESITSVDMSISKKTVMLNVGGKDYEVLRQNSAVKMRMPSKGSFEMETRTFDSETGENSYTYFKNGYMYIQLLTQKCKVRINMDHALAYSSASIDLNLTEEKLKDTKIEMLDEGMKITYKTDINDLPNSHPMTSLRESEGNHAIFSPVTTSAIIGYDGILKSGSHVVEVKITASYGDTDFRVVQTFKINSVNSVDLIKFPADLASYEEF